MRYWDGSAWTDHVSDRGETSLDPVAAESTDESRQDGRKRGATEVAAAGSSTDAPDDASTVTPTLDPVAAESTRESWRDRRKRGATEAAAAGSSTDAPDDASTVTPTAAPSQVALPEPPQKVDVMPTLAPLTIFGGSVEARDGCLFLSWKGISSSKEQKKASPHRVDLREVTSIQAHEPGKLSKGWVRFGRDALEKTPSTPPRDFYTVVVTRSDAGYQGLLSLVDEVSRSLGLVNPLPEPGKGAEGARAAKQAGSLYTAAYLGGLPGLAPNGAQIYFDADAVHVVPADPAKAFFNRYIWEEERLISWTDVQHLEVSGNEYSASKTSGKTQQVGEWWDKHQSSEAVTQARAVLLLSTSHGDVTFRIATSPSALNAELSVFYAPHRARRSNIASGPIEADPIEQIRRLSELHAAGILSEEEYKSKKAELLGRL